MGKACHLAAVYVRDIRVDVRGVGRKRFQALIEFLLPGLEFPQTVDHALYIAAVLDDRNHRRHLFLDAGQLLAVSLAGSGPLPIATVYLLGPGAYRVGRCFGRHQTVLEAGQDALFEHFPSNAAPVRAAAVHDMVGAAVAVLAAHGVGAGAGAAFKKAREEVPGAVGAVQTVGARLLRGLDDGGVLLGQLFLPVLHRLPEFVIDDAEFGNLRDDPFLPRIDPGHPLAGLRVLDVAQPVPDQAPDVELVVDQSGAALGLTADGGIGPELARGTGDVLGIQTPGNGPRADAGGELPEHAADDPRLNLVDRALTPFRLAGGIGGGDDVVAVTKAAPGATFLDPAAQAAMGLRRKVLQEQGVHRALEADMELVDLALGEGDDHDSGELQVLEQRRVRRGATFPVASGLSVQGCLPSSAGHGCPDICGISRSGRRSASNPYSEQHRIRESGHGSGSVAPPAAGLLT